MSLPEIPLRQKYSLSFFTVTLLVALTSQSSLAFSIKPLGPVGATGTWDPDESYTLPDNKGTGTTTLNPTAVTSITRGGTSGFLATLKAAFSTWTFNAAPSDLAGSFEVQTYDAQGTPSSVGAEFRLQYNPAGGDPTPTSNELHWIQRVVDNHNITNNPGHGNDEDVIDIGSGVTNPFYDTAFGVQPFDEKTFYDFPKRPDADQNHNWSAELYLVEQTAPQKVTIYNGIQWGWKNEVVKPVPEPLTILGSGMALGFGALFKKEYSRKQKKAKSPEK